MEFRVKSHTIIYKYNLTWSSNDSNTSPIELFHLITYDFRELVSSIKIRYLKADPVRLKLTKNNSTEFIVMAC